MDLYDSIVARTVERGGTAVALGGLDSGKTSFCRMCAAVAARLGRSVAYIDGDVGQSMVGPPATIGLKFIAGPEDLEPERLARPDTIYFVGATSPKGHFLPMVMGVMKLVEQARAAGVDLIMVDTTGFIHGTQGQVLTIAMVESLRPDAVVGFQRGGELEPILGGIRRLLPPEVEALAVDPAVQPTSVEERAIHRQDGMRRFFEPPLNHWKVKTSVFVPQIPPELDPAALDRILVGLEDGKGNCIGLGILEYREDGLRMMSTEGEGAKALRLGSVRVTEDFGTTGVDLRDIFISD